MHEDVTYWTNLSWPAAPNQTDYELYQKYCTGRVLLLGSTKSLLPLADEAWDLNPKYTDPKIKHKNWTSIDSYYDTIIGDGVLVFSKQLCDSIINKALENCRTLVIRTFLEPSWNPKYAKYFPRAHELNPAPTKEIKINNVYSFYIWQK